MQGRVYTCNYRFIQNSKGGRTGIYLIKETSIFSSKPLTIKLTCFSLALRHHCWLKGLYRFFYIYRTTITSFMVKMPSHLIFENKQFLLWFCDLLSCCLLSSCLCHPPSKSSDHNLSMLVLTVSHCVGAFNLRVQPTRQLLADNHGLLTWIFVTQLLPHINTLTWLPLFL